jgi:hypothetical protein
MDESKYFTLKIPKKILLFVYIPLCIVIVVIAYNNWPRYVVLNPPMPDKGFVIREEKMIYNPSSDDDVKLDGHNTWTWRREYGFLPTENDSYTSESIAVYFDMWLNQQGWKKFEGLGNPCDVMTKAGLLEDGANVIAYVSENTTGSYYSSVVCLAAGPYTTEDNQTGFKVLLFTATK